jgi:hypothetical protein
MNYLPQQVPPRKLGERAVVTVPVTVRLQVRATRVRTPEVAAV